MPDEMFREFSKKLRGLDPNRLLPLARTVYPEASRRSKLHESISKLDDYLKPDSDKERIPVTRANRVGLLRLLLLPALHQAINEYICDETQANDDQDEGEIRRALILEIEKSTGIQRLKPGKDKQRAEKKRPTESDIKAFVDNLAKFVCGNFEFAYAIYYWFRIKSEETRYGDIIDLAVFGKKSHYVRGSLWPQTADQVDQLVTELCEGFLGRAAQLQTLDKFVETQEGGLLILSAPAGSGKSALLATWQDQRQEKDDKVALHFVSTQYERTTGQREILGHLLEQVKRHASKEIMDLRRQPDDELSQQLFTELSSFPKSAGRLILILDGLDEADHQLEPFLEAQRLAENVFVIVSGRQDSDEVPSYLKSWRSRIERGLSGKTYTLPSLEAKDVVKWLERKIEDLSSSEKSGLAEAIRNTTDGLPLFLKYVLQDLADNLSDLPTREARMEFVASMPAPFPLYVAQQLERLQNAEGSIWSKGVERLLATLSITLGPIHRDELQSFLGDGCPDLNNLDHRVSRWLSIRQGMFSFSHPRLARAFAQVIGLSESEIHSDMPAKSRAVEEIEDALIDWMEKAWQPKETRRGMQRGASYALDWLPEHLAKFETTTSIQLAFSYLCDQNFIAEQLHDTAKAVQRFEYHIRLWGKGWQEHGLSKDKRRWVEFFALNGEKILSEIRTRIAQSRPVGAMVLACMGDAGLLSKRGLANFPHDVSKLGLIRSCDNAHGRARITSVVSVKGQVISIADDGSDIVWNGKGSAIESGSIHAGHNGYAVESIVPLANGFVSVDTNFSAVFWSLDRKPMGVWQFTEEMFGKLYGLTKFNDCYVSYGADSIIYFWTPQGLEIPERRIDSAHHGGIKGLLIWGRHILTWGRDEDAAYWDCDGNLLCCWQLACSFDGQDLHCVTVGGQLIVYASKQREISIWQLNQYFVPERTKRIDVSSLPVLKGLCFLDGWLAAYGYSQDISFIDIDSGSIRLLMDAHIGTVAGVLNTDDGIVSWDGGALRFWDVSSLLMNKGHSPDDAKCLMSECVCWADHIVTLDQFGKISIWSLDGKLVRGDPFEEANIPHVFSLRLSGDTLVLLCCNGQIMFWNWVGNPVLSNMIELEANAEFYNFLAVENKAVTWPLNGFPEFWLKEKARKLRKINKSYQDDKGAGTVNVIVWQKYFVSQHCNGNILFWDTSGDLIKKKMIEQPHGGSLSGLNVWRDMLVSWGRDGKVRFWRNDCTPISAFEMSVILNDELSNLIVHNDTIVVFAAYGAIEFWHHTGESWTKEIVEDPHEGEIYQVISLGNHLASVGKDAVIRIWDERGVSIGSLLVPDHIEEIYWHHQSPENLYVTGNRLWVYSIKALLAACVH